MQAEVVTDVSKEHIASMFNRAGLKMQAICSFETLVTSYKTTRRHNLKKITCENFKSQISQSCFQFRRERFDSSINHK
jgi:hypothetical protein